MMAGAWTPHWVATEGDSHFAYVRDIVLIASTISVAMGFENRPGDRRRGQFRMSTKTSPNDLAFEIGDIIANAANDRLPTEVALAIIPKNTPRTFMSAPPGMATVESTTHAFASATTRISAGMFALFAEDAKEAAKAKLGKNWHEHAPITNFARIVRNAIVHHGVHFESDKMSPGSWRDLTYAPANNGHQINQDLDLADVIELIFETRDELVTLGAWAR